MPPSQGAEPGIVVKRISIGEPRQELVLDSVVTPAVLLGGIEIEAAGQIEVATLRVNGPQQAVLSVSIGLPYPLTDVDQFFWPGNDTRQPVYGFTTLELASRVNVDNNSLVWTPAKEVQTWLLSLLFPALKREGRGIDRLLVRLTLRGNFLLAPKGDPELHLDGDVFRTRRPPGYSLPSGDGRRGGDLEVWFWLEEGP
ncbi:hypothetical protein [Accumulibacter sp.]|uniref:hypothetical protein n=1 Tax=Accumulibacter sp. TaxID=2053492 RepID=UPI001ACD6224|nr:hypothetical protein [Accumulibacter sp.]MBN8455401.1 hypothetical protein [Accumulibacter sp.]